jgi:RNA polymerase sigma factor (sigma-70 family)
MKGVHAAPAFREMHRLFRGESTAGLSDEDLLGRFLATRDASALEAIVVRHGPSVLASCRAILGDGPSTEDAFQAVFLILVRKAPTIRVEGSLGRWLRGVSRRVAIRAAKLRAKQRDREVELSSEVEGWELDDRAERGDVAAALNAEIAHLPASYREPIVAHYFEGLSHQSVAARLRWPVGTVKGRLARARRLLRDRLARRGIGLSSSGLAISLAFESSAATIRQALRDSTVEAAIRFTKITPRLAEGTSPTVSTLLAEGALRAMTWTKFTAAASIVGLSATLGAAGVCAAGGLDRTAQEKREESPRPASGPLETRASSPAALADLERRLRTELETMRASANEIQARERRLEDEFKRLHSEREAAAQHYEQLKTDAQSILDQLSEIAQLRERIAKSREPRNQAVAEQQRDADPKQVYSATYPVRDLITALPGDDGPSTLNLAPLVDLITESVAPGTWKTTVDDALAAHVGSITTSLPTYRLVVRHNRAAHEHVKERLKQLRRLCGLKDVPPPLETPVSSSAPPGPEGKLVSRTYNVADLVPREPARGRPATGFSEKEMQRFSEILYGAIDPESWGIEPGLLDPNGRPAGSVRSNTATGEIIVEHTESVQNKVNVLLSTLRRLRQGNNHGGLGP